VQAVADVIRTTLGPRSMLKMLLDASGGTSLLHVFEELLITSRWMIYISTSTIYVFKRRDL